MADFVFAFLALLTLCVSYSRYLVELEPPVLYNHLYNGQVVERVMPVAEVRNYCDYAASSVSAKIKAEGALSNNARNVPGAAFCRQPTVAYLGVHEAGRMIGTWGAA
jgi:hypothetical protein